MVRKLKHHEQKLLKKTDFITYKQDNDHRDHDVIRRTLAYPTAVVFSILFHMC